MARHPFVVLEGVTCTRREVADRLAVRVWVDAPADERLRRGVARDGESHRALWERWMREETAFFADDGTRERADVVVDGTACARARRPGVTRRASRGSLGPRAVTARPAAAGRDGPP